jgi:hypothetical protein
VASRGAGCSTTVALILVTPFPGTRLREYDPVNEAPLLDTAALSVDFTIPSRNFSWMTDEELWFDDFSDVSEVPKYPKTFGLYSESKADAVIEPTTRL